MLQVRAALFLVWLFGAGTLAIATTDSSSLVLRLSRTEGPQGVVYGLFDELSGERVARVQIGRMSLDYGKQGVFRVAWKARVVLHGVELKVMDPAAWPQAAVQLADLLDNLGGGRGNAVLHDVVLEGVPVMAGRVTAARATLSPAGELILSGASNGDGDPSGMVLPLRPARPRTAGNASPVRPES